MEILSSTLDSFIYKCNKIEIDNIKYGELVILVGSDDEGESVCSDEDLFGDELSNDEIANESSVEDVLEIVRQATIVKKEPTVYELAFGNVSSGSTGKCDYNSLIKFLHSLGMSPTHLQCEELKREFGTENIDFEKAMNAYGRMSKDRYTKEELIESLRSSSSEINRKRLLILLQAFGDKMSEEDINKALDKLEMGAEPISKELFIEKLCSGSKQIRGNKIEDGNKDGEDNSGEGEENMLN
ncbi:myosin regulatory light chain [Cryptosporidium ryanae]|uniref:myosin regulatory light chain n=1 Tax=Cryptosporidium ryanae TaxID=515981 RepID=UPI00351A58F8|nr:myosin regulatory light chain [Cryptosporidium ryanae]